LEDELTVHPNRLSNARQRMDTVVKVRDLLQQHGVQLIITTVPDKTRIQQNELCKVYRPASANERLIQWENGLRQRGIHLASLIKPLEALASSGGEQPFLKADTHWSQAGAQAAAEAILGTIEKNNIVLTPKRTDALSYGALQPRTGDLVRLAGIDWLPQWLQPPTDWVRPISIQAEQSEQTFSQSQDASQDLFGDTNLPIVALLGTSFSRTSSFAALLERALQTPVPSFALDGGDFWVSAKQYLKSDEYRKTPPRVVIWEVPERVIQMPISKEEEAWMSGLSDSATQKNR
jgi:alginate O-acetyltransferase complex protein AlgJ